MSERARADTRESAREKENEKERKKDRYTEKTHLYLYMSLRYHETFFPQRKSTLKIYIEVHELNLGRVPPVNQILVSTETLSSTYCLANKIFMKFLSGHHGP